MRRLVTVLMCAVLLGVSPAVADPPAGRPASPLDDALGDLVRGVQGVQGRLGVAVIDLDDGELLVSHGADVPLNPASNMKIVTAWAALEHLGPQHRYLTGLYGRIRGDGVARLTLSGEGDPSLDHSHLWQMAARLHRAGVRRVGDIIVDQSAFDAIYTPPAFAQQPNEWASFRAPVAAVSVARNTVTFELRATQDGDAARVSVVPESFVQIHGRVQTGAPGATETVRLQLKPEGDRLAATLGGRLPEGANTLVVVRRVEDPRLLPGYALRDVLTQVGIEVDGQVKAGTKVGALLSAHRSASIAQLLHRLGKFSDNFYAEMIFKSLSVGDQPATFARSAKLVRQMLNEAGIDPGPLRLDNGSGLFDANRLTAAATAQLLRQAFHDPRTGPELLAQLSIAGTDGTLRARLRAQKGRGNVRAKTGTLAAVSAFSGYVLGERRYAVSVLLNDVKGKAVPLREDIDRFVTAIVQAPPR